MSAAIEAKQGFGGEQVSDTTANGCSRAPGVIEAGSDANPSGCGAVPPPPTGPDPIKAYRYVASACAGSYLCLSAIDPRDGRVETVLFRSDAEQRCVAWIERQQAQGRNIYHEPAEVRPQYVERMRREWASGRKVKRPKKSDLLGTQYLHCDVDPRAGEDFAAEQERLRRFHLSPSWPQDVGTLTSGVMSGGGVQYRVKLRAFVSFDSADTITEVEARNRWLAARLGGDRCHDAGHLLRVPFTTNYFNEKKRKARGCDSAPAYVLFDDRERVYALEDFPARYEQPGSASAMSTTGNGAKTHALSRAGEPPKFASVEEITELQGEGHAYLLDLIEHCGGDEDPPDGALGKKAQGILDAWKAKEKSRSQISVGIAKRMILHGCSHETVVGTLLSPAFKCSAHCLAQGDQTRAAERAFEEAREKALGNRAAIIIRRGGTREREIDAAAHAMVERRVGIYQRGGELVHLVQIERGDEPEKGVRHPAGSLLIHMCDERWTCAQMDEAARWRMLDKREKGFKDIDAPLEHARFLHARKRWPFPALRGIVEAPTLRPGDLSILESHGYDERSGLYVNLGGVGFPSVPEAPTKAEAERALDVIVDGLFRCFPFEPDEIRDDWKPGSEEGRKPSASRSVALSAVLTGLVRPALRTSPLHAITARQKGTGKGKIAGVTSLLVVGRSPSMMSQGASEEEDEKRLGAVLLAGSPVVVIDNVERTVRGAALCTALTEETMNVRVLGLSKMVPASTSALVMMTGNNLTFAGDMTRRVVPCRLDARDEDPGARRFDFDPVDVARARRPELVVAGLTILRAYLVAGCPGQDALEPFGSFEDWSLIRGALVWLGQPDPAAKRRTLAATDPERERLVEMMDAWEPCFGSEPKRVSEALAWLDGRTEGRRLEAAFAAVSRGGKPDAHLIGLWFRKHEGKPVGARMFVRVPDPHGNGARIALRRIGPERQRNGVTGLTECPRPF